MTDYDTLSRRLPGSPKEKTMNEEKRARFLRIAERRTTNALEALRKIRSLGNRARYDFAPEHAAQIVDALQARVDEIESALANPKVNRDFEFTK